MKNVVRSDVYRGEKEFAVGRLGSVVGSTFVSGIIVGIAASILTSIFGQESSIVDFVRTMLTSMFAGALAVEVLFAYREDRTIRVSGFLKVLSENVASFLLVAVVMGVINVLLGLVTATLEIAFIGSPGLAGIISIIMMIVSIYISCATAFKYYLIKDKDMGVEAIAESFKISKDVIFDIIAVTVRYMWIPVLAGILTIISALSFVMPLLMYGDIPDSAGGSIGIFLIGLILTLILSVYFGARLVIANGILYSQVIGEDYSEDNIVGTAAEEVVEVEVVEEIVVDVSDVVEETAEPVVEEVVEEVAEVEEVVATEEVEVVEPEVVEPEVVEPENLEPKDL